MRATIIYREEPPARLVSLLEELAEVKLLNYQQAEEQILQEKDLSVVFCQIPIPDGKGSFLVKLHRWFPLTAFFSYHTQDNSLTGEEHRFLDFLAHINDQLTAEELVVHLDYATRFSQQARLSNRTQVEQALSAVMAFHYSLDILKVVETALKHLPKLFPIDSLCFFLGSEERHHLDLMGQWNAPETATRLSLDEAEDNDLVRATKGEQPIVIAAAEDLAKDARYEKFHSVLLMPLHTRGRLVGVIEMATQQQGEVFNSQEIRFVEQIVGALSSALANANAFNQVERLGQIDDLTQLYNSRYLYKGLEAEIKRSRRYKTPISVIFIDLDGFKQVNDINGHLCGSATLTEVANLMIGLVRETDIVARYGGDEFVLVLPETPAEHAVVIAERIRKKIETNIFRGGGDNEIYLTASFGVASYPENASSPAALIRCADKAMYVAKECNKNQVVLANQ